MKPTHYTDMYKRPTIFERRKCTMGAWVQALVYLKNY